MPLGFVFSHHRTKIGSLLTVIFPPLNLTGLPIIVKTSAPSGKVKICVPSSLHATVMRCFALVKCKSQSQLRSSNLWGSLSLNNQTAIAQVTAFGRKALSNSKSDMLFSLGNIVSSGTAQHWKNLTSFFGSAGASPSLFPCPVPLSHVPFQVGV